MTLFLKTDIDKVALRRKVLEAMKALVKPDADLTLQKRLHQALRVRADAAIKMRALAC